MDEIEAAHAAIGGTRRGRRFATQQINHAYVVLLSAHFQRFCRDLHSEAVDHLLRSIMPAALKDIVRLQFTQNRKLDTGNPNPGNIGSDFARLGIDLWPQVLASNSRNTDRRISLESMNMWRNAIAHQDIDPAKFGGSASLRLGQVRRWRTTCGALATEFDAVVGQRLTIIVGSAPW
jgi:hypothetical protein